MAISDVMEVVGTAAGLIKNVRYLHQKVWPLEPASFSREESREISEVVEQFIQEPNNLVTGAEGSLFSSTAVAGFTRLPHQPVA
jgi:hypothetical protein